MIVAAAIERNGLVFSMPAPARHHHILHHMSKVEEIDALDVEQGFLTSMGIFVRRRQARRIAWKSGQISTDGPELFSEDLW